MKRNILVAISLFFLSLMILIFSARPGRTELIAGADFEAPRQAAPILSAQVGSSSSVSPAIGCATQPTRTPTGSSLQVALIPTPITLSRFRQTTDLAEQTQAEQTQAEQTSDSATAPPTRLQRLLLSSSHASQTKQGYTPKEVIALADPTNYGDRFLKDLYGRPADLTPIIVMHETVGSADSAIQLFQTSHPRDEDQVSYHTLIERNGTIVYLVPPDKRAYGAGDSVFESTEGIEAVQTNPNFPPSVNNFAYHISLESPPDGNNNNNTHSGYTSAQYQSLAWLTAKTGVSDERLTTHKLVDRSGTRKDPRSFNAQAFLRLLDSYPRNHEIAIGCPAQLTTQPG